MKQRMNLNLLGLSDLSNLLVSKKAGKGIFVGKMASVFSWFLFFVLQTIARVFRFNPWLPSAFFCYWG